MGVFEMVVAIVAISCSAGVLNNRMKLKNKATSAELDALEQKLRRLDKLEHRIQVLEKILTDKDYDLHQQLEDLEKSA